MTANKRTPEPWHDDARQAVRVLREGGILLHATDTVWGLACDATNDDAVQRLNQLKARPPEQPMLVLVADEGHVEELVPNPPEAAWDLMAHSDRPTTIVYPEGRGVSPFLLGPEGSLAIRCIRDPYTAYVIRGLRKPIASTSANMTGHPTPTEFKDVSSLVKDGANHISNHRQEEKNKDGRASMMVAFDHAGRFSFIRR